MIMGSVTIPASGQSDFLVNSIKSCIDLDDFFYPVQQPGFTGGYYLNPRLPCKSIDIHYTDIKNDLTVLFSGYIYNNSELLYLFNIKDQVPDPELIAKMFLLVGPGCVEKINGDFTFLVHRPEKGESYIFRDHIGIRPLGWTIKQNNLYFSSDLNGLCRALSDEGQIEIDYLLGYLKFIDYKKTPNRNVTRLLPGHYLRYTEEGAEVIQYWYPQNIKVEQNLQYDRMLSELNSIVNDSVKIRCDSRFIAGAHVTGGIDSCLVASLARSNYQQQDKFFGFSWSPENFSAMDVRYDERDLINRFCAKTDIEPVFSIINPHNFNQLLSSFYHNHGFFSEESTSEQVEKINTNLLFSGWGGDEFISTGDRGVEMDLLCGFKFRLFFKRNPLKRPLKLLRYLLYYVIFPALGILDRNISKSFKYDSRYLKKPYKKSDGKALADFYFHISRQQLHLNMLKFYHLQDRCENWTIMGFRKGIEYRYPLLDKRIIEYMLKVPSELLCQTDYFRPILREIGKGILPEDVRLNWDKSDPVYWSWMDNLFKITAIELMKEVSIWKTNFYMYFVDFDLLEREVKDFRTGHLEIDEKILFRSLVYFKAIHEFFKDYNK